MQNLIAIISILFVVGLIIKYWWVVLTGALIIGFAYGLKRSQANALGDRQLLKCANLTRTRTDFPAAEAVYTAIDIETTGLHPDTDRIVEIGLVKFAGDGTILDEFATLVNNPGSDSEAQSIHQIDDADLVDAPDTEDVLREAFALMSGTVVVAHNFDFEARFLAAAAKRHGLDLPDVLGLCTLQSSQRQLDGRAYSLTVMYKTATGEFPEQKHTALGDARAVREILLWLLRHSPSPLYLTDPPPRRQQEDPGEACSISCRPAPSTGSSVAALLVSFPQSPRPRVGDSEEIEKYLTLLDESVQDGRLTYQESRALSDQARRTRLTGTQLGELHRRAWEKAFPDHAEVPWEAISATRRREMFLLAEELGLEDTSAELKSVIEEHAEPEPSPEIRYLRGLRIGIVGDHPELDLLRERAESHGAQLAKRITKTVQWMATITPEASDSHHNSARELGIPIISPAEANERLGESIRAAELKAFERQRHLDELEARRAEYEAQREVYWRPVWRPVELDHAPEYDFY